MHILNFKCGFISEGNSRVCVSPEVLFSSLKHAPRFMEALDIECVIKAPGKPGELVKSNVKQNSTEQVPAKPPLPSNPV